MVIRKQGLPDVNGGNGNTNSPTTFIPFERIQTSGNTLANRASGIHRVSPSRPVSAQTRLYNLRYENPSAKWTINPEGPAYIPRVPGLPQQQIFMPTVNGFSSQPRFLSPMTNMQIQNQETWYNRLRMWILGTSTDNTTQSPAQIMFPSAFAIQE